MVSVAFLLVSISYALISGISFYTYFEWLRKRIKCLVSKHMLVLGVLMLVPLSMTLVWAFGSISPSLQDIHFLTGFFAVVTSIVVLLLVYEWTENRNIMYILLIYAFTIFAAYQNVSIFFSVLSFTAFIVTLIAFLDLFVASSHHIKLGSIIGSVYALLSLALLVLSFLGVKFTPALWAIPNILLAFSILMIYLDGKYCMLLHPRPFFNLHHHKVILHLVFVRYLFYTLGIAGLLLITTVSVHELGHALVSNHYQCEQSRIVFDLKSFPHTEILCNNVPANDAVITIAGLLATSLMGGLLWLTGERFSMKMGRLLLVYGFLVSYQDLFDLGVTQSIITMVMLGSLLALLFSFYEVSRYYIESQRDLFASEGERRHRHHRSAAKDFYTSKAKSSN